jgi:hypothetical protein
MIDLQLRDENCAGSRGVFQAPSIDNAQKPHGAAMAMQGHSAFMG